MKPLSFFVSALVIMIVAHTAMGADQLVAANTLNAQSSDYASVLRHLNKSSPLMMAQEALADGGSCSVKCDKGSSSKTCANQGENCSCDCTDNGYPSCTACSKE